MKECVCNLTDIHIAVNIIHNENFYHKIIYVLVYKIPDVTFQVTCYVRLGIIVA